MSELVYFAYGSNMSTRRLCARVSSAQSLGMAILDGHALTFHKVSDRDGSGKCDIIEIESTCVFGVLFQIHIDDKRKLDTVEGLGMGYAEKSVTVTDANGDIIDAITYVATNTDPGLKPFSWYLRHVMEGATEAGHPDEYLRWLHRIESIIDHDPHRERRELAIYDQ